MRAPLTTIVAFFFACGIALAAAQCDPAVAATFSLKTSDWTRISTEVYSSNFGPNTHAIAQLNGSTTVGSGEAWVEVQYPNNGDAGAVIGLDEDSGLSAYNTNRYLAQLLPDGRVLQSANSASTQTETGFAFTAPSTTSRMRLHVAPGGQVSIQTSLDNGSTWTIRYTYATIASGRYYWRLYTTSVRDIYQPRQVGVVFVPPASTPSPTPTRSPTPSAAPSPAPANVAKTFDALYASNFALKSGTTYYPRPAQPRPITKSASVASPAYTDPNFGTKIFQVTDTSDIGTPSTTKLRNDYSKRQMFNSDGSYYIALETESYWHLYNSSNFAHINVPGGTLGRMPGIRGTDCDPFWHPTNPNKLWYTGDFGTGGRWYELDVTTGQSTFLFPTFAGRLPPGLTSATNFFFAAEGAPSADGRYFTFMACTNAPNYPMVGMLTYDRVNDTILSYVATTNKPNWVGTSPDGKYAVIGWHNFAGIATIEQAALRPTATADGTRAYPINGLGGSVWTQLDLRGEHGDIAMTKDGRAVWVSVSYAPGMDVGPSGSGSTGDGDGYVYFRYLDTGEHYTYLNPNLNVYLGDNWNLHFSGKAHNRPGWAVIAYEIDGSSGNPNWKDGTIMLLELVTSNPRVLRVAHHHATGKQPTDITLPLATPNRDLTRILFGSDWRGGAAPYEQYMVGLPSWAVPN